MNKLINRKVLISMIFIGLTMMGLFSYRYLLMELYPDAEFPPECNYFHQDRAGSEVHRESGSYSGRRRNQRPGRRRGYNDIDFQ